MDLNTSPYTSIGTVVSRWWGDSHFGVNYPFRISQVAAGSGTYPPAGDLLVSHQVVHPAPRQGGHLPHLALPHRPSPHGVAEEERGKKHIKM